jgi:hypothetical protein
MSPAVRCRRSRFWWPGTTTRGSCYRYVGQLHAHAHRTQQSPPRLISPRPTNSAGTNKCCPRISRSGSTYFCVATLPRRTIWQSAPSNSGRMRKSFFIFTRLASAPAGAPSSKGVTAVVAQSHMYLNHPVGLFDHSHDELLQARVLGSVSPEWGELSCSWSTVRVAPGGKHGPKRRAHGVKDKISNSTAADHGCNAGLLIALADRL